MDVSDLRKTEGRDHHSPPYRRLKPLKNGLLPKGTSD
jgi:hypothetical protein